MSKPEWKLEGRYFVNRSEAEFLKGACPQCGGDGKIRAVNPAWLRGRRLKANVTLRDMARRLSFSAAYLCDIEHGRRAVTAKIHEAYRKLEIANG